MKIEITEKPWGREILWAKNKHYAGKILEVKKGERLSLQLHEKKTEAMYILQGNAILEIEDKISNSTKTVKLEKASSVDIEPKTVHRLIAIEDSRVLEVSTPELTDVVRLKDDYGRDC